MRIFKEDIEYQGTPDEIARYFELTAPIQTEYAPEVLQPFDSLIDESQSLREKLANDPAYNPFPGVVPSKESENTDPTPAVGFADEDTGIVKNG